MSCSAGKVKFYFALDKLQQSPAAQTSSHRHTDAVDSREGEKTKTNKPTINLWGAPSQWQICSGPDAVLYSSDLLDRGVSSAVWVSDKLFSHDASPCLRTLVKSLQCRERQRESSRNKEGWAIWTSRGDGGGRGGETSQCVMEETRVTVTTGRWREIEGDWEVAGLCFCSLTAWQSSLD